MRIRNSQCRLRRRGAITEQQAWNAIGLTTIIAIMVWIDTGSPVLLCIPIALLVLFEALARADRKSKRSRRR